MKLKAYRGYDNWKELINKYKNADFNDVEIRKQFRKDFNYISTLMWNCWFNNMERKDIIGQLVETWCSDIEPSANIGDTYREAYLYCSCVSDRMNINRWMHIRILLNYDIE